MATTANSNAPKLRKIDKGPKIIKRWINPVIEFLLWLADAVRKNKPVQGKNVKLTETATGLKIDVVTSNSSAAYVWNLFPSPWQGDGPDPNASDRAERFRILTATINGRTPVNPTDEFVAFGSLDPTIEEGDAVWTQVYAQCSISESSLGQSDLETERATIMLVQGRDLQEAGVQTPAFGDDGSLPSYVIISLGVVKVWGGTAHYQQYYYESIVFTLANGGGCELSARNFIVSGGGPGQS